MTFHSGYFLCFITFVLSFSARSQTNNYILVDEDKMDIYVPGTPIDGVISSSVNTWFDYPQGPPTFPNAPQGIKAFIINTVVGYTGVVFDKTVTACPGAAYYYKFFIGNEWTTSNSPNGPNLTVQIEDALGTILWSQNYPNIQYAFQEVTTSTFIPTTSTIHFKIFSNLNNPPSGGGGDGVYKNDAVFDHLRLYQNNPSYNYQTATGTSGVSFCESDPPTDLANYLYWPMSSGTWSGPSTLPNPNGTFDPSSDNPGLYTFTNNNTAVCPDTTSQINVLIAPGPEISPQIGISFPACGSITLPNISGTNIPPTASYFTGPNATGTEYQPGDVITSTMTLYAYASNGSCFDQETYQFNIAPIPNAGSDSVAQFCDAHSPIDLNNFIGTADNGTWSETSATPSGHFNSTTGVFNIVSSNPGTYTFQHLVFSLACPNDTSFVTITIIDPLIDPIANVTACEAYTFQPITGSNLSGNSAYYTGLAGTGTEYHPGDQITNTDTIYVFDISPTDASCWAQEAFIVTINQQNTAGNDFTSTYCAQYSTIDLDTLITGQDAGGTWLNTSGATSYNSTSNTIDVAAETDGDYIFQYIVNSTAPCVSDTSVATIHVSNISINPISNTAACENFTFGAITGNNLSGNQAYYTQVNGGGTQYNPGDQINSSDSIYIYDVDPSNAICFAQESFVVTVNQQNTAGNDFTSTYCAQYNTIDLDTLITGQDAGGSWLNTSGATSYNSTSNTIDVAAETDGDYIFQYIVNSTAPCVSDTSVATIHISNIAINPIANTAGCENFTFGAITGNNLSGNQAYYTQANGGGTQYNLGDQINSSDSIYIYDVDPANAICFAQESFVVTINQQYTAGNDFTSPYCMSTGLIDLDTLITGQNAGGTWVNIDGATSYDVANSSINTANETEGTYTFQYIVNSTAPCVNDTSEATITILEEPNINLTVSDTLQCFPGTFNFYSGTNTNPNFEYSWTFGNGNSSTLENPTVTYTNTGCYDVFLSVSNTGGMCSVDTTVINMVCVIPSPIADFTTNQDTLTVGNNILTGTNYSSGANAYWWDFGDASTDTAFAPNHTYDIEETGSFTITLVATNAAGCSDTTTAQVYVQNELKIVLPNIFTPNGDYSNDVYTVNMQGVKHLQWVIVNRWGNEITNGSIDTEMKQQHYPIWKGEGMSEGVYYIVLKYTDVKGKVNVLQQHITLSR